MKKNFLPFAFTLFLIGGASCATDSTKLATRTPGSVEDANEVQAINGERYVLVHESDGYMFSSSSAEKNAQAKVEASCKKYYQGNLAGQPVPIIDDSVVHVVQMCRY
jgi:hypothetical protein